MNKLKNFLKKNKQTIIIFLVSFLFLVISTICFLRDNSYYPGNKFILGSYIIILFLLSSIVFWRVSLFFKQINNNKKN